MIKAKFLGVEIGVDFTFFAILAMFLTLDTTGFAMMSLLVCIIHETGHLLAMAIQKHKVRSILFRGGGITISSYSVHTVLVLISGSAVNIVLFVVLYFTLPKTNIYPIMFAVLNLIIGMFNLLPIGCLDGSRLLELMGVPRKALRVFEVIALVAVAVAIAAMLLHRGVGGVNFTLAAAMVYVVTVDFFSHM